MDLNYIKDRIKELEKQLNSLGGNESFKAKTLSKNLSQVIDNHDFYKKNFDLIEQISESNGSRYYKKQDINVGIVADEFLYNVYKDIVNLHYISKDNYKEYIGKLDVFFVVTTWQGLNREWYGLGNIRKDNPLRLKLYEIIDDFRKAGSKIVFYSKEDPPNYDVFLDIANNCDYIFTTAVEKIEDYKRDCNNLNVDVLEFGINPIYHNPIGSRRNKFTDNVIFSGSWYKKYPERCDRTNYLFKGALDSGYKLSIIDRNSIWGDDERYRFPKEYDAYRYPALNHEVLQKTHKLFDWAFNLSSETKSATMTANRVYELQALGNLMISNYSVAINNKFPNIFLMVDGLDEIKPILKNYTHDEVYKLQMHGLRSVMTKHTAANRFIEMIEKIGVKAAVSSQMRSIAVVCREITDTIQETFNEQSYSEKVLFSESEVTKDIIKKFDMVTFFHPEYVYEEFYLETMINAFKYTDCDYITKDSYYIGKSLISGIEHDYVDQMKDKYKTIFWSSSFDFEKLVVFEGAQSISNGYSVDHFELNMTVTHHTEEIKLLSKKKISVIVPVYNNGDHLLGKCFLSLRRSTLFDDMEILLIDDGSTDNYTPTIVNRLSREYPNVKTYFFNDGGSGSASRPRNKGLELASADFIVYLDPDNEAVNDGYYKLYEEITKSDADFAVGTMLKLTDTIGKFKNHSVGIVEDPKDYILKSNFSSQSTQAMIIRKEFLLVNGIDMVNGAIGEDTLFFYELLAYSKKVIFIDTPIHIYYAGVEGSSVNAISARFYKKYLVLEKEKIKRLRNHGLLKSYLSKKYEYYFEKWYLAKFTKMNPDNIDDVIEAVEILHEIYSIYNKSEKFVFQRRFNKRFIELAETNQYEYIIKEYIYKDENKILDNVNEVKNKVFSKFK